MWINIGAIFETLLAAAITFVLHTALMFAAGGILWALWIACKWIYRKVIRKK